MRECGKPDLQSALVILLLSFDDATVVVGLGTTFALRLLRSARMPKPTLTSRVQILEQKVEVLETLPERVTAVELQIVQLREEMRDEFSAVRQEMNAMGTGLRAELSAAIRAGDEETRRYMRVLHEEVISRIASIQEGLSPRRQT